jgi:WS/DGAT/MGAT family acyltransferase
MLRPIPLVDLAFLWIDRPETPANVGALLIFDPPGGHDPSRIAREVLRAYRSRPPTPPFDSIPDLPTLGLPQWRRIDDVDLRRHVLLEKLEPPGDPDQLRRHVARLHEKPLDRSRPLFEVHVIHGLATRQFAVYLKSHHANWDGRYAMERVFGNLARKPGEIEPAFFAIPDAGAVADTPAVAIATGLRTLVAQAAGFRELFGSLSARSAARSAARSQEPSSTRQGAGNRPFAGPHTRLNEPVTARRELATFELPLDAMRRVAHAAGGTLNDAALAVVDAGVGRYLASLGERPGRALVAMCPVAMRDPADHEATTRAATFFVPLGSPRAGPAVRLRRIVAATRAAKDEFRGFSREAMQDYAALAFGLWFASNALGLDAAIARPVINFVLSNVGAIDGPRYLGNSRLASVIPVSMLANPCGLNVTAISLEGRMQFGVLTNAAAVDASRIADECRRAFADLAHVVRPGNRRARASRTGESDQDLVLRKPPVRKPSRTRRMPASQRS